MYIILYIQCTQFFKEYIKLCTLHVDIIQRMYRIVYIFQNCIAEFTNFFIFKVHNFPRMEPILNIQAVFVLGENHFRKYFSVFIGVWLRMENAFFGNGFQLTVCWV